MTQLTERPPVTPAVSWWRRPWVAPLAVLTLAFLAFSLPPYLSLDPAQARLPLRAGFPAHYAVLLAHIGFGTVALVTCGLQVWPWFRQRHPAWHRRAGRVYVFAGVLPAGLTGIVVSIVSHTGYVGRIGNLTLCLVWLATTFRGYRTARLRRYADHRRWMVRSFALTTSIVANRVWIVALIIGLSPTVDSHYGGDINRMIPEAAQAAIWLSWVVNLVLAEWWLERTRVRRSVTGRDRTAPEPTPAATVSLTG
ncbi:hypothetical protein Lfu02_02410 [Longispora fulva]|uniref:Uncharacterized protein n=1 Tax=Longispora fulva TaxID=619741 RepID=A0A8J7G8X8_9ACTN|nr:DUF2306 domain-containing protein [Longispora fulva]MBG6135888.1 hypothetical protein [Longispora fulva]GIG55869.1 hypothetical protein Lfu02_02410 [Longispora fulva]